MAVQFRILATLLCVCVTLPLTSSASVKPCDVGEFVNRETNTCQACYTCPINQIIRVPCSRYKDTQCGHLYASEFHNQPPAASQEDGGDVDSTADQPDFTNLFQVQHGRTAAKHDVTADEQVPDDDAKQQHAASMTVPCLKDDSDDWRMFSYMLIATLALLMLLFIGYVIFSQVHMHRIHAGYKMAGAQLTETRTEPIYCYSRVFASDDSGADDHSRARQHHHLRSAAAHRHSPSTVSGLGCLKSHHQQAAPNDYVIDHRRDVSDTSCCDRSAVEDEKLLPVIASGETRPQDDHVRVVYTSKK